MATVGTTRPQLIPGGSVADLTLPTPGWLNQPAPGWTNQGIESIVRPHAIIESFLGDRTVLPPPEPLEEAEMIWGKESQFTWSTTNGGTSITNISNGGVTIINPDTTGVIPPPPDNPSDPPIPVKIIDLTENTDTNVREEETVRISNPSDEQQYVDVARIKNITFDFPNTMHDDLLAYADGRITDLKFRFIIKTPEAT